MEIKANGDQSSDTTCRIESMSRGGVIRLLDQIKNLPFPNFSSWQILAIVGQVKQSSHDSSKHAKSILAAESKACNLQECKGKGLEDSNAIGDTDVFPVVRIDGAILHPR